MLVGDYSISARRSEINLVQARNFLVGILSSTVGKSIIFRLEDTIQSAWKKVSNFGLGMPFFVGKFQLPAGGLVLGLNRIPCSGRGI